MKVAIKNGGGGFATFLSINLWDPILAQFYFQ